MHRSLEVAHQAGDSARFCILKQLHVRVFLLPPGDGMLFHLRANPSIKFPIKFAVRVNCLAQEHNAVFPARAQTQTAWSRDEGINLEATMPPNPIHKAQHYHWFCWVSCDWIVSVWTMDWAVRFLVLTMLFCCVLRLASFPLQITPLPPKLLNI